MTISYKVTKGVISLVMSHSTTKGEIIFHLTQPTITYTSKNFRLYFDQSLTKDLIKQSFVSAFMTNDSGKLKEYHDLILGPVLKLTSGTMSKVLAQCNDNITNVNL